MNMMILGMAMIIAQTGNATNQLTILEQAADAAGDMRYYRVAAGDLDGDGRADKAILQVRCADGLVADASIAPRESASGMATGKRQHKPMTITKEWGAASPQLATAKVGYDVKKVEGTGARAVADGWTPVALTGAGPLCSLATINTSHSNIKN